MAVSKYEDKIELGIKDLKEGLTDMPVNMRLFSLTLRSLFTDKAVGGESEAAVKFRKLRDDTRNDAMVYLNGVLPVTTSFVSSISGFFEYFTALSFEEWYDGLDEILQETNEYKGLAEALISIHQDLMIPLEKRRDQASIIVKEIKNLQEEYLQKKTKYEENIKTKRNWAFAFLFVPVIGAFAAVALEDSADRDLVQAIAKGEECNIHESAAVAIMTSLVPALSSFIKGLHQAAAFFSVIEQELGRFKDRADKSIKDRLKLNYKLMKNEAEKMDQLCQRFFAVLPAVRTDFRAIPETGTDTSYVDKWLEKQKKALQDKAASENRIGNTMEKIADSFAKTMQIDPMSGLVHHAP